MHTTFYAILRRKTEKLTDPFTRTVKGDLFLLHDNNADVNRVVIFCTKENLAFLNHCDDWYMDGTFDITPAMFNQVYTIHGTSTIFIFLYYCFISNYKFGMLGRRENHHFPLVYALACKKDYFTYECIFNAILYPF